MYPGDYAKQHPDRPAVIMAQSGEALTYAALEARANQLSHLIKKTKSKIKYRQPSKTFQ